MARKPREKEGAAGEHSHSLPLDEARETADNSLRVQRSRLQAFGDPRRLLGDQGIFLHRHADMLQDFNEHHGHPDQRVGHQEFHRVSDVAGGNMPDSTGELGDGSQDILRAFRYSRPLPPIRSS